MNGRKRFIFFIAFSIITLAMFGVVGIVLCCICRQDYEVAASMWVGFRENLMKNPDERPEYMGCQNVLNDRIEEWRTHELAKQALYEYKRKQKSNRGNQVRSDDELLAILSNVRFASISYLDLVTLFVRADDPKLATQLAKSYVDAIVAHVEEESHCRINEKLKDCRLNVEWRNNDRERLNAALSSEEAKMCPEWREKLQNELRITEGILKSLLNTIKDLEAGATKDNHMVVLPGEISIPVRCSEKRRRSIRLYGRDWFYR